MAVLNPDDFASVADYVAALFALVPRNEATNIAVKSGSWFDPATWADGRIPAQGAKVLIPEAITVNYDGVSDTSLFTVRVDGKLQFATNQNTRMVVDTLVVAPTGLLQIGTKDNPVQDGVTADILIANDGPIDVNWDPLLLSRGIQSRYAECRSEGLCCRLYAKRRDRNAECRQRAGVRAWSYHVHA
jgi:hypothetical protein